MPDIFLIVFGAVLGLIFGSFGTVLAYRAPRGEKPTGRSHCPKCGRQIKAIENVPVFSYLFLRGRCRGCGQRISLRYPLTELGTGILFALSFLKFDFTLEAFVYSGFFFALVVLSMIDLETKRLPDVITGPALLAGTIGLVAIAILRDAVGTFSWVSIAGLVASLGIVLASYGFRRGEPAVVEEVFDPEEDVPTEPAPKGRGLDPLGLLFLVLWMILFIGSFFEGTHAGLAGASSGSALFGGFFFSLVVLYEKGMGLGDAKLGLLLGAFTGFLGSPDLVVAGLFIAFVLGGAGGAIYLALGGDRKDPIPFGPFLALGAALSVFLGQDLVSAYSNLIGG